MASTTRKRGRRLSPRPGTRLDLLMRGELSAEDLTEEELLTGIVNDKNGDRSGRPSNLIPREFHTAVVKRLIEIGEGKLQSAYLEAAENIVTIALGDPEKVDTKEYDNGRLVGSESRSYDPVVLKAAQYVFERIGGRTPEIVAATLQVQPWDDDVAEVFIADPGMARRAPEASPGIARGKPEGDGAMP